MKVTSCLFQVSRTLFRHQPMTLRGVSTSVWRLTNRVLPLMWSPAKMRSSLCPTGLTMWQRSSSVLKKTPSPYIKSLEGEPIHVEKSTIGILNCDSKREFWIQFLNDSVRFGQGSINEVVILEAFFPYLIVETLSISTKGVRGIWTLNQQSGE